jgi:hypothetical protein
MSKKVYGEMSLKQAERVIETYENAIKNGEEWAHRVFLHRGTDKYAKSLDTLNEAFRIKEVDRVIHPMK